jgi:drug/metabolite transporter (DMT)-like permease
VSDAPAPASRLRNLYIGIVCAIVGSIGFSAKTIIVKLAYQYHVEPLTLVALRMLLALPIFLVMAAMSPRPRAMSGRDWLTIVWLGFIGFYVSSYLDFTGLQYVSAGLGRLILYLFPTLVLLFSAIFLKQPVRARHVVSLAISYCGIALVFLHDLKLTADGSLAVLGALLVFGSATTYAVYLIMSSRIVVKLGTLRFTAYASTCATFFVVLHFALTQGMSHLIVPHPVYWLSLLMATVSTVLPLLLMAEALRRLGANQTALLSCVGPISTLSLAYLFLDEPVNATQLAGAALVLGGVMIISLRPASH